MADKKKKGLRILIWLWLTCLLLLIVVVSFFGAVASGYFGPLPSTEQLENPKQPIASEVISADGVVLGKFYQANRAPVDFEDLSPSLVKALVATEDVRFFEHSGIDFKRSMTIIPYNLIGKKQGASTISQQLAKNLFPRAERLHGFKFFIRKLQEWVLAVRLERLYTKEEIMAMYLNTVEFNNGAYGIKSAASTYFNKTPDKLNEQESALLVGMLKGIGLYDPILKPKNAFNRRNTVLALMKKHGDITDKQYLDLSVQPIKLDFKVESHNEGIATYFREYIRNYLKNWAAENGIDMYRDGIKIYTTIDSRMQRYAEEAMYEHLKGLQKVFYAEFKASGKKPWTDDPELLDRAVKQSIRYQSLSNLEESKIMKVFARPVRMKVFSYHGDVDTVMSPMDSIKYYKYFLQSGFMAMEPTTGYVKVWTGGVDYKFFKYDHCAPYAKRQVGSTFKPFVYATAVNAGFSPCQKIVNAPVVFEEYDNWTPKNSDNMFDGQSMTLAKGLATSTNRITASLMKQIGIKPVINMAQTLGIRSKLDPVPSLCLGVADISLNEMVPAYNAFNNMGTYVEPIVIARITDKNGKELKRFVPSTRVVLDDKRDYVMLSLLKGVCNPHLYGTASRLKYRYNLRNPMAGKTGTTQNNADGWFMGLIPQLTGGVWVGCEDPSVHFASMASGQGSGSALPVWATFLQKVYADKRLGIEQDRDWPRPDGDLGVEIDCDKYENQATTPATEEGGDPFKILDH